MLTYLKNTALWAVLGCLTSVAAVPGSLSAAASLPISTANVAGLHVLATQAGKLYFGTATDNPELTNTSYTAILNDNQMFGQITAANSMKWVSIYTLATLIDQDADHLLSCLADETNRMLLSQNRVCSHSLPGTSSRIWRSRTGSC